MSEYSCTNCANPIQDSDKICPSCGYPQHGTKAEQISYNGKLFRVRDLVEDSDKSVKGILSFAIIFVFMAFVVLLFSLIFKEQHYNYVLVYALAGAVYFLFHRLGKKSAYLMATLTLLFYLGHTIFEFSNGMFIKSPVGLDKSFLESKGTTLFFAMIPLVYLVFRMSLTFVLAKYLWIELKLKKDEKMVRFIRDEKKP